MIAKRHAVPVLGSYAIGGILFTADRVLHPRWTFVESAPPLSTARLVALLAAVAAFAAFVGILSYAERTGRFPSVVRGAFRVLAVLSFFAVMLGGHRLGNGLFDRRPSYGVRLVLDRCFRHGAEETLVFGTRSVTLLADGWCDRFRAGTAVELHLRSGAFGSPWVERLEPVGQVP